MTEETTRKFRHSIGGYSKPKRGAFAGKHFKDADDLWSQAVDYFEWAGKHPLWSDDPGFHQGAVVERAVAKMRPVSVAGFCNYIGISKRTFDLYSGVTKPQKGDYSEYYETAQQIQQIVETAQIEGAAAGLLNSNIIARLLGLSDKQEQTHQGPGGTPVQTQVSFVPVK